MINVLPFYSLYLIPESMFEYNIEGNETRQESVILNFIRGTHTRKKKELPSLLNLHKNDLN